MPAVAGRGFTPGRNTRCVVNVSFPPSGIKRRPWFTKWNVISVNLWRSART